MPEDLTGRYYIKSKEKLKRKACKNKKIFLKKVSLQTI